MSSLKINFKPSASGCQMPNGPTRDGPHRFCMWPTTLRSSSVVYATAVSSTKSASAILISETRMNDPMPMKLSALGFQPSVSFAIRRKSRVDPERSIRGVCECGVEGPLYSLPTRSVNSAAASNHACHPKARLLKTMLSSRARTSVRVEGPAFAVSAQPS